MSRGRRAECWWDRTLGAVYGYRTRNAGERAAGGDIFTGGR